MIEPIQVRGDMRVIAMKVLACFFAWLNINFYGLFNAKAIHVEEP